MLSDLIKDDCGLVNINPLSIGYMVTCVQLAFRTKDCVFVYFKEGEFTNFYFMPSNETNQQKPRLSKSLSKDEWNATKESAFEYIKECTLYSKFLKELTYHSQLKVHIIRTLPKRMKMAQTISEYETDDVPMTC